MEITAYQHGIYPRSEALVRATRDLDRGRTSQDGVAAQVAEDERKFLALQQTAGLDFLSDGLLRSQDLFRPFVDASPNMEAGGLVRYFDNNSFFRTPIINAGVGLDVLPPELRSSETGGRRVASLPSPYFFSRAATAHGDADSLMEGIAADLLRPIAEALLQEGCELIHLEEPWLGFFGIETQSYPVFEKSIGAISDGLGARVHLHVYFGDASPHADLLRELPVDAIGFDLIETDFDALGSSWPTGLVAGCIDGRSSILEQVDQVVEFLRGVADSLQPKDLSITSSSELELLGEPVARKKVGLLGEVAARAKEALG